MNAPTADKRKYVRRKGSFISNSLKGDSSDTKYPIVLGNLSPYPPIPLHICKEKYLLRETRIPDKLIFQNKYYLCTATERKKDGKIIKPGYRSRFKSWRSNTENIQ